MARSKKVVYPDLSPAKFEHIRPVFGKKNGFFYGNVYRHIATDRLIYIACRQSNGDIFCNGLKSPSAAIRAEKASWAVDEETYINLKAWKVSLLGFHVKKTNDLFFIKLSHVKDRAYYRLIDYSAEGGELQRYIWYHYFWKIDGLIEKL